MSFSIRFFLVIALVLSVSPRCLAQSQGSPRDVQIRSINFDTQVLELHNFGIAPIGLDGWRFCTHDENGAFHYSSNGGLNGLVIAPGDSLFVHWLNDSGNAPGSINRSRLGGSTIPDLLVDSAGAAISIGIYRASSFSNPDLLNDHLQYSFGGAHVPGATPRSGVAVTAELWTDELDWVAIDEDAIGLELTAGPFPGQGNAHGSDSYELVYPLTEIVQPESAEVLQGNLAGGAVGDLGLSDNVDMSIRRSSSSIASVAIVEFKGMTTILDPRTVIFTYEGSVFARARVTQTISLFNFDTGSYEEVDSRTASRFADSTVTVEIAGDLSRFIENDLGCVQARIRFNGNSGRLQFTANMDQAIWEITD